MQPVDLLIEPRWIIPIEPDGVTLEGHSLAVDRGRIVALLPTAEATARFGMRREAHQRGRAGTWLEHGADAAARVDAAEPAVATKAGALPGGEPG